MQRQRGGHGQQRVVVGARPYLLKTHRLAWELAYGAIPAGLQVNHHCDVPTCVRPEHLYLGTQQDNLTDARRRGRLIESLPRTKRFTPDERLAIYHMPDRRGIVVELALHYRVSKPCITAIRQGRFAGSPFQRVFQRVPHFNLPIRGDVA